jgi:hypothetical protein
MSNKWSNNYNRIPSAEDFISQNENNKRMLFTGNEDVQMYFMAFNNSMKLLGREGELPIMTIIWYQLVIPIYIQDVQVDLSNVLTRGLLRVRESIVE